MKNDLTTGKIAPTLLKFALPFLLANALQAIYGATDLFIIGHFTDPQITSASVSAVATGSQFMHTITMLILGLCIGTTVIIAKIYRSKRLRQIIKKYRNFYNIFYNSSCYINSTYINNKQSGCFFFTNTR